jgi:hypothetical protein
MRARPPKCCQNSSKTSGSFGIRPLRAESISQDIDALPNVGDQPILERDPWISFAFMLIEPEFRAGVLEHYESGHEAPVLEELNERFQARPPRA